MTIPGTLNITPDHKKKLAILLICVVVFIAFLPSLFCDFTNWDDRWMLIDNPLVRKLTPDHVFGTIFGSIYSGIYQPLVFLTYAIEYYFFGLNPFVFHLTNLLLHLLITVFVFIFINQLSGNILVAVAGCLFWTINPLRVESVTWVTERKDLLYALFYLLSLIKYVHYLKSEGKKIHLVLSLIFFIFSCLSKLTAVSLSLNIVLLDYFYQRKLNRTFFFEKAIYFAISLAVGIFSIWAVTSEPAMTGARVTTYLYTPLERMQLVSYSFINYILKSFIPYNLSAWHPYQYPPGTLPGSYLLYLIITVVLVAASGWYFIKFRNKKIIFGFLFFFASVVFALQIFPVGDASFADRNIYIACVGVAFLTGELFLFLTRRVSQKGIYAIFAIVLLVYGLLTFRQTKVWSNSITLWTDIIKMYPADHLGYINRGAAKFHLKNYTAAIADYELSLQRKKNDYTAMINMAQALKHLGSPENALKWVERSLNIYPGNSRAFFIRGEIYYEMNKYKEAINDFSKTLSLIRKDDFQTSLALTSRARAKIALQQCDSALLDLDSSISLIPDNSDSWHFRGLCYYYRKNFDAAEKNFFKALEINPTHEIASFYLGMTRIAKGEIANGCTYLKQSAQLSHNDAEKMFLFYCSNEDIRKNMFHSNGKLKFQLIRGEDAQKKPIYHFCSYDTLGTLTQQGEFDTETGKYFGEIRWYYPDGSLKKTGFSRDTITYGKWKEYYKDGTLRAEYYFSEGKMDGLYQHYYPAGGLWTERVYQNGSLVKINACNDKNGKPLKVGSFSNGNGTVNVYDENGKVIMVQKYKDGFPLTGN